MEEFKLLLKVARIMNEYIMYSPCTVCYIA
jgi:hypothetical protein